MLAHFIKKVSALSGNGESALDQKKRQQGRQNRGVWNIAAPGFSSSSSSDRLTEEQENEIAENIYDWWISGKSYKQWYAEKFQQMKLDFGEF